LHINFELIEGCNLRCDYCPCRLWLKKKRDIIPFDKYKEIIDEGVKNNLCSIELNGINEPLLQSNIIEYIKYAHSVSIPIISLHTNATLLNKNIANRLIESGLTLLIFSLDAVNKNTYETIRRGATYEKVVNNINSFLELKQEKKVDFPLTRISFVMNKLNQGEFLSFYDFWKEKVDYVSHSDFCNPFVGMDIYEYIENKYRLKSPNIFSCNEPFQRLFVCSNGDVCPCCSFFGKELKIGNIYQDSILELWNNEKMKKVRELVNAKKENQPDACKKCRISLNGKIK